MPAIASLPLDAALRVASLPLAATLQLLQPTGWSEGLACRSLAQEPKRQYE
jgi:hypothetical protein